MEYDITGNLNNKTTPSKENVIVTLNQTNVPSIDRNLKPVAINQSIALRNDKWAYRLAFIIKFNIQDTPIDKNWADENKLKWGETFQTWHTYYLHTHAG